MRWSERLVRVVTGPVRSARVVAGAVLVSAALLASAACSGGGDEAPAGATLADATSTTRPSTTTEPADPYAIPEDPSDIDEAYLNKVFEALNKVRGDALRISMETNSVPPEVTDRLVAVYGDDIDDVYLEAASQFVLRQFQGFRRPPGDEVVTVDRVEAADRDCVVVRAINDESAQVITDRPPEEFFFVLTLKDERQDPNGHNPTPWVIDFFGLGEAPPRCDA